MSDDILERAKALRDCALPRQIYSAPGQTGYGSPSLSKGWDFSAVDELVRVVVPELIAEVERLRRYERLDRQHFDRLLKFLRQNHLIEPEYDEYPIIIDSAIAGIKGLAARIKEQEGSLDEAEALIRKNADMMNGYLAYQKRLEAAFLAEKEATLWDTVVVEGPKEGRAARHIEVVQQMAREALERIKEGKG